jgi:hypothetical protein
MMDAWAAQHELEIRESMRIAAPPDPARELDLENFPSGDDRF